MSRCNVSVDAHNADLVERREEEEERRKRLEGEVDGGRSLMPTGERADILPGIEDSIGKV